jgi:hypothetical protein
MPDYFEHLATSKAVVGGIGCAMFVVIILSSLFTQQISFGSIPPKIRKSEYPRTFWSIIFLYGVIAAWAGVTAALSFL